MGEGYPPGSHSRRLAISMTGQFLHRAEVMLIFKHAVREHNPSCANEFSAPTRIDLAGGLSTSGRFTCFTTAP
jgi:hypothetical protein